METTARRSWTRCPDCRASIPQGAAQCPKCGRSAILTQAEEVAMAAHQIASTERRRGQAARGCASAIAAGLLVAFGLALLLFWPVVGLIYFGLLGMVVLLRIMLR